MKEIKLSSYVNSYNQQFMKQPPAPPPATSWWRTPVNMLTGAAIGAGGTSAVLGLGGAVLKRRLPFLSLLLRNAAKDGITVFDPRRAARLVREMPQASKIMSQQMHMLNMGNKFLSLPKMRMERIANRVGRSGQAMQQMHQTGKQYQRSLRKFKNRHGRLPMDTMGEAVGGISGLASAAAGAGVAGLNSLTSN